MRTPFAQIVFAACLAGAAVLAVAPSATGAPTISRSLQKPLSEADKAIKANDLATVLAKILEARALPDLTDFDKYTLEQFAGNLALKQNDYKAAETSFKAMAQSPAMPATDKANIYTVTVEVAANVQDWPTIVQYGELLQAMGPLDPKLVEPVAVAYYNTGAHDKALALAKQQVDAAKAAGQTPSQSLLSIVTDSQLGNKNYSDASASLEEAALDYGNPNDWARLIDLGFTVKGIGDMQALYLYRLRMATDATTGLDDYAAMGQVTTKAGYPGEAVAMLEHGIAKGAIKAGDRAGSMLAAARTKAAEDKRALPGFDAQARARKTGDFDAKLAETYYGYGRYAEAEEAARRAIGKGGVKDPAEAPMLLGISLAMQGKNAEAVSALSKVGGNAADQKIAHLWTLYVQRKYTTAAKP